MTDRLPFLRPDDEAHRATLDGIADWLAPLDGLRTPLWLFVPARLQIVWGNRSALAVWEAPALADLQARDLGADMSDAMRLSLETTLTRLRRGETVVEISAIFPRGHATRVRMVHHRLMLPDGTEGMLAEADVEPPAEDLVQLASGLSLLLAVFRSDGSRTSMNPAFRALLSDHVGSLGDLMVEAMPPEALLETLHPVEPRGHDLELDTARGTRTFRVELRRVRGAAGDPCVLASLYDVTTQRQERAELLRLAHTDVLTGLPNRHGVTVEAEARQARGERFDVLYVDLDGLKQVNDGLGHRFGDLALEAAARRIATSLPADGFAGRMGGDEFVAFVPHDGMAVAERVRVALSVPYTLDGLRVLLTASIGVTSHADLPEADTETRLRLSDTAMLEAKRDGRNQVRRAVSATLQSEARIRRVHQLLPAAMQRGELRIVVQPIVRIADGSLARAEALVRWRSRELGDVPPIEFVPVAEQSGIVRELGRIVLQSTTDLLRALGDRAVPVAVNLSAREVVLPTLADDIHAELVRTGIDPALLTVELTETAMVGRLDLAQEQLARVRALGVRVALDDFGTGYSALSIVHRLDLDTLKVDRSLVRDLPEPRAMAIVRAILRMAESLGLSVVAEGVETREQADALATLGCPYGQGYLWARPLELGDFMRWQAPMPLG
jgi:diguanylate cyclase (GGDEF)-like protein